MRTKTPVILAISRLFRLCWLAGHFFSLQGKHVTTMVAQRCVVLLLLAANTCAFISPSQPIKSHTNGQVSLQASASKEERVSINYCTGCRWMLRAAWMAQELLTTFQDELDSVTLIPSRPPAPGGVFVCMLVWILKSVARHCSFTFHFAATRRL